jgi:ATP-binding cassette subfamily F protein 3
MDESPLWHLQRLNPKAMEKELRGFLGGFDFQGDKALNAIAPFSGGEKARLALALLIYQRPNLLLLDEPTNHLDLEMRFALSLALQDFAGALVVVSHDRYLLRTVTDDFWLVGDGQAGRFDGDLEDYRKLLGDRRNASNSQETTKPGTSRKDQRRLGAEKRQQLRAFQQSLSKAEAKLKKLAQASDAIEAQLADPLIYEPVNKKRLQILLQDKTRIKREMDETEAAWLEAGELMDSANKAPPE